MSTTLRVAIGLLALFVLTSTLTGCNSKPVRYETREIPGPKVYAHIPKAYTGPLKLPTAQKSCRWPADDPNGQPTRCNDEMRAERDALRDVVGVCIADRAAVRALSDRAVKRNKIYGAGEEEAEQEGE